jgi:hypothetical protein
LNAASQIASESALAAKACAPALTASSPPLLPPSLCLKRWTSQSFMSLRQRVPTLFASDRGSCQKRTSVRVDGRGGAGEHLAQDLARALHVAGEPALLSPHEPQDFRVRAELDGPRQQRIEALGRPVRLLALRRPPAT